MSTAGPAAPAWWAALPPADAQVSCGAGRHSLHWAAGRLSAIDHPDAEGELVIAALGGERPGCVDLAESWGGRSDDLEVLAVGPRSAADELTASPEEDADGPPAAPSAYASVASVLMTSGGAMPGSPRARARMLRRARAPMPRGSATYGRLSASTGGRAWAAGASSSSSVMLTPGGHGGTLRAGGRSRLPGEMDRVQARQTELFRLLALGPEFQMRLSGTVAAAWAQGGSREGDRATGQPALVAALAGRLAPAAQSWLGIDPDLVEVTLHEGPAWGQLTMSGGGSDRRLHAALPVGWLASVWAAGLAVVAGHLIVEVTEAAWPRATVLGVREPGAEPVTLRMLAGDGGWVAAGQDENAGDENSDDECTGGADHQDGMS